MSGINSKNISMRLSLAITSAAVLAASLILSGLALAQEPGQKTFATSQDAGKALYDAVNADDQPATLAVLGQSAANIVSSGDAVQDKNSRERFLKSFTQMSRWGLEANGDQVLYIGADNWPFPIPLKKDTAGQWYFDTKSGLQEILFRRIGKNELAAIQVCNALVDAQEEYYQGTHDGDATHQYAQKIVSEEGKQNGLFWKVAEGQPESPIGPLVAFATAKGYGGENAKSQPFYGYFFHVLTAQGKHAPGGAKSYLADGKMTGGFAFVAYPAEYRNSGVMTFLVDKNGIVYQKDLGPNSTDMGKSMTAYDPDKTWVTAEGPEQYNPGSN